MASLTERANEFLEQKRIAVVGVSRTTDDAANAIYRKLRDTGYEVFPVNPNAEVVEGDKCYASVASIPNGVDGAVIVTKPEVTEQVVKDCKTAGVKRVWMHKSIGNSVSDVAVAFCKDNGIEVIPGACPMMFCEPVDFGHKCMHWYFNLTGKIPKTV